MSGDTPQPAPPGKGRRPYRVYRGGRPSDVDDPIVERLRAREAAEALDQARADQAAVVAPPSTAPPGTALPPIKAGGPIVLPDPTTAPRPAPAEVPPPVSPRRRFRLRRPRWRWVIGTLALLLLLSAAWLAYGYWQFRNAMARANKRLPAATRAALTPSQGSILDSATTILVLGSDARPGETASRSDSILLIHSDPGRNQLVELSIPRDLRVPIAGVGEDKINAAYAIGGAPLAIHTVADVTGLPINHIVLVDFGGFKRLIDSLGGITIVNPEKIVSNSFDGLVWHFAKGRIHLDGRHALAYSRVRENRLNPNDNDLTRGLRQQRVLSALTTRLSSISTLTNLPSVGSAIADPLTTDLSGNDIMELGWRKLRSSRTLHCRLGGTTETISGQSFVIGDGGRNAQVLAEVLGRSAPQPPPPGDVYAPGCTVS